MPASREERIGTCRAFLGDSRELLPTMRVGQADAVVTDPPYGIDFSYASHQDDLDGWKALMLATVPEMKRIAQFVVLPSCAIKRLPWWYENLPPDWIIAWYKGNVCRMSKVGFNQWEPLIAYGRPKVPMVDHFTVVPIEGGVDTGGHPCPKPLDWALWLVQRAAPEGGVILDPFGGSGTTGRACIKLNRRCILIENDPEYFEVMCESLHGALVDKRLEIPLEPLPNRRKKTDVTGFW